MINLDARLTVLHDDNGTFSDHTVDCASFLRDSFVFDYTVSQDALYIGYRKPINVFYVDLSVLNSVSAALTIQYYKGGATNAFTTLSEYSDDTDGLTRSGFVQWDRNPTDEEATTVNSTELFWYKLTWDATLTATTAIRGINIVFSDDQDLKSYVPAIANSTFLTSGETSHIFSHVAARNYILQRLSLDGNIKANYSSGDISELNQFDILNVNQLREASALKTLSIIYSDLSDSPEDKYQHKANEYNSMFENTYSHLKFLNIDMDDDGIEDRFEEMQSVSSILVRR